MSIQRLLLPENRPFPVHPQVNRYFRAKSIEESREQLVRTISRGEGPGLVVASAGMGKSLLLQALAAQFHEEFDVVLLSCAQLCTRRALLQAILFELELPYRLRDEGEIRLSLLDHLLSTELSPRGLLLLVDEAQSLPLHLLEELRILTNLVQNGEPRVRLVLAGSPSLEESLASPELESFNQRLAARCYLAPLHREETIQYVQAQLAASKVEPESLFAADAWDAIFDATDGVPRLINQLCDRALCLAGRLGKEPIDRAMIQHAWADLQQLPTSWEEETEPMAETAGEAVVEFGSLVEENLDEDFLVTAEEVNEAELLGCSLTEIDEEDEDDLTEMVESPEEPVTAWSEENAADPFADEFEEEEVVLDRFAPLANAYHPGTPQVVNQQEPELATLVQAVLEPTAPVEESVEESMEESMEESLPWGGDGLATITPNLEPLTPIPLELSAVSVETAPQAAVLDPVLPEESLQPFFVEEEEEEALLVVDEEPLVVQSTEVTVVPGDQYNQMFAKLRGR